MRLAAIGSNCVDYYRNLDGGRAFPGGGPVNMAVYTCRLGGQASYIGPVGSDDFGKLMRESVQARGVDVSHMYVKEGRTAVSQVELKDGERIFGDYDEGVLENYRLSEDDLSFIAGHDIVVCDLWGKVYDQFADLKSRGIPTAFDCATRPESEECGLVMPYIDYLFFSTDQADGEALRNQMKRFQRINRRLVIAMMGEMGSLCYDGERFISCGIVPCDKIVDSMGAGDSYIAGFLYAIAQGRSVEDAMYLGAATATETLSCFGAWT